MTDGLRTEFMAGMEEIERATDPEAWADTAEPDAKEKPYSYNQAAAASAAEVEEWAAGDDADSNSDADDTADTDPAVGEEVEPIDGAEDFGETDADAVEGGGPDPAEETPPPAFGDTAPESVGEDGEDR